MFLNCGRWRRLLRVPCTARRSNQSILRKSVLNIGSTHAEAETPVTLANWCKEPTHWKRPWCWERLKEGGEGGGRGWDGLIASPTQWRWVWTNPGRQWRTGKLGVLQSIGSQRVEYNLATEQLWHPGIITESLRKYLINEIFHILFSNVKKY